MKYVIMSVQHWPLAIRSTLDQAKEHLAVLAASETESRTPRSERGMYIQPVEDDGEGIQFRDSVTNK